MPRSAVEIEGLARLVSTMRAAAGRLDDLEPVNRQVAAALVARARPPRRTGRLAASLTAASSATEATMTSNLPYAGVIAHGGYHNIDATHYDTEALSAVTPEALEKYRRHLDDTLATVKGA